MKDRDEAFEVLCEVSGIEDWNQLPAAQRGKLNQALGQLRAIYEDDVLLPQMIRERAAAWIEVYPEIPVTAATLVGNWGQILQVAAEKREREKQPSGRDSRGTNLHGRVDCDLCQGDHVVIVGTDLAGNDETAPCPDCNPNADATYWADRKKIVPLSPEMTRERIK